MPTLKTYHREFQLDAARADVAGRTVPLSFSSEKPVLRDYGYEVLSHKTGSVDDTYVRNGLALLESHNSTIQIGVVRGIELANKRLIGSAIFGNSAAAAAAFADVREGIRTSTSFGYTYSETDMKRTGTHADGNPIFTIQKFTPYEVSLVSIPADPSVGVGRSHPTLKGKPKMDTNETEHQTRSESRRENTQTREAQRVSDLLALGESYRSEGGEKTALHAIKNGCSTDWFCGVIVGQMEARSAATTKALEFGLSGFGGPFEQRAYEQSQIETPRASTHYDTGRAFGGRDGEQRAHRFGMWVRGAVLGDKRADAWCREHGIRAMSTGDNTAGGFTVPQEFSNEFILLAEQYGVARKHMRRWIMASDVLSIPRRNSGPTAYFVAEANEVTASDQNWGQVELHAKTLASITRLSNQLLEDNAVNLANVLAQDISLAFATKEDNCAFSGDGTSTYGGMQGLRTKFEAASTYKGYVQAAAGHDLFAEIDASDLSKMMGRLPAYARPNAKFYCSQAAISEVFERLMVNGGGNTILSTSDKPVLRYMGHEIVTTQAMPNDGTADLSDDVMILFGDLSMAAAFGDRRSIELRQDPSRYLEYLQTAIVASERFDVVIHDIGDATNAGPVVALIGAT